ncbi:MAG: hypothetical protein V1872_10365 [bacterium]
MDKEKGINRYFDALGTGVVKWDSFFLVLIGFAEILLERVISRLFVNFLSEASPKIAIV